jgi:DNA repair protein RecN (Recombination protein N)
MKLRFLTKDRSIFFRISFFVGRITSITIEFDDSKRNESQCRKLINDPEQLDLISQKLQVILICKETQVATITELLEIQSNLENSV